VSGETKALPGERPTSWERSEALLVALSAGGSLLLGLLVALFPAGALALVGLPPAPPFLVRQAGVLYLVLAIGFGMEFRRNRGVVLLVTGQALTALFLGASWLSDGLGIQIVLFIAHAWLAAVTWAVHELAQRQRWSRVRLKLVAEREERVRPAGGR
jgi:hypothetical protein